MSEIVNLITQSYADNDWNTFTTPLPNSLFTVPPIRDVSEKFPMSRRFTFGRPSHYLAPMKNGL